MIRWKPWHDSLYEVFQDHIISESIPLEETNSQQRWQTFSISEGQLAPGISIPTGKVTDRARLESASGFREQTSKQDSLLETRRLGLAQSLEPCKLLTSDCTWVRSSILKATRLSLSASYFPELCFLPDNIFIHVETTLSEYQVPNFHQKRSVYSLRITLGESLMSLKWQSQLLIELKKHHSYWF